MYQNRRKLISRIIFFALLLGAIWLVINYFTSSKTVSIRATNITSLSLREEGSDKVIKELPGTATSVRVKKTKTYVLAFTAANEYASGATIIAPETKTVTINPDFSEAKLQQILDAEISSINNIITTSGTNISTLYTIDRGQLSHFGEWYFTTLTYKGPPDVEPSDTLVVGVLKKDGAWVAELLPNIIFTTADNPKVSREFIDAANAYQNKHVTPVEELYYR